MYGLEVPECGSGVSLGSAVEFKDDEGRGGRFGERFEGFCGGFDVADAGYDDAVRALEE